MINKFIKYFYIIVHQKNYFAKQFEFIILNKLIKYYEISSKLTNNKNKFFTFNYWKTLILLLKTKLKMFIVYYSQINNQTKRINQSLKQYLRYYINNTQNNWISLLFMTQLILNAKISNIIKISSFFANFEKKLNLFEIFKKHKSIDAIIQKINILKRIHENIIKMQTYFVNY